MGLFDSISKLFNSGNVKKADMVFSGKNKKAISDGLKKGSTECGKVMRRWKDKKK